MNRIFIIVYNDKSKKLANDIANKYHKLADFLYLHEDHPKEKKEAIYYKSIGGTRCCPFIGVFDKETHRLDGAIWGEVSMFDDKEIKEFFEKWIK